MYAVIRVGGKQQKVKQGDVIETEFQKGEEPGKQLTFKPLLVVGDDGKPLHGKDLSGAKVVAKVVGEEKGEKVKVVKFRPKTRYTRRQGHRQMVSLLEITDVSVGKRAAAAKKETPEPKDKPEPAPASTDGGDEGPADEGVADGGKE